MPSTHRAAAVAVLPAPAVASREDDPPLLRRVRALAQDLFEPGPAWSQEQRAALLSELETLKNACAGAQATVTLDMHEEAARDREQTQGNFGHARREREGVTAEVAMARRVSPARARQLIGLALTLPTRLPHLEEALRHGRASEWAAGLVAKATAALTEEQALAVDAALAPALGRCSEAQLEKKAIALAYEADKRGHLERTSRAVQDRHVSMRPVADGMVRLSALVPMAEGIAAYASLDAAAAGQRASGATASRGALRADELIRRLTGIDPTTSGLPVEIGLVMTDRTLFDDGGHSARVPGYGPVPAAVARMLASCGTTRPDTARRMAEKSGADGAAAWVRRLFTDPVDGSLAQMDTRRRLFSGTLRRFVVARDQECAMPYCGAMIRAVDHLDRARDGGATSGDNGQGTCESCNLDKEAEDLRTRVVRGADGRRAVSFRTRYGQSHTTGPPPVLDTLTDLTSDWHGVHPPWWSSTAERPPGRPRE